MVRGALFTTSSVVVVASPKLVDAAWWAEMVVLPALSIVTVPLLMVAMLSSSMEKVMGVSVLGDEIFRAKGASP